MHKLRKRGAPRWIIAGVLGAFAAVALPTAEAAAQQAETHLLKQLYLSGLARVARGDPAAAVQAFQIASEVAPELPQMQYSLALTMVLSDFAERERALPVIDKALARDPSNPLYEIVRIMADPAVSTLRQDGALYLTAAGADRLHAATSRLSTVADGYNARYLTPVLGALEASGDPAQPARLAKFASMVGPHGSIQIGPSAAPLLFGRLFAMSVPDAQLNAYEGRLVARLQNGLGGLTAENVPPRS